MQSVSKHSINTCGVMKTFTILGNEKFSFVLRVGKAVIMKMKCTLYASFYATFCIQRFIFKYFKFNESANNASHLNTYLSGAK